MFALFISESICKILVDELTAVRPGDQENGAVANFFSVWTLFFIMFIALILGLIVFIYLDLIHKQKWTDSHLIMKMDTISEESHQFVAEQTTAATVPSTPQQQQQQQQQSPDDSLLARLALYSFQFVTLVLYTFVVVLNYSMTSENVALAKRVYKFLPYNSIIVMIVSILSYSLSFKRLVYEFGLMLSFGGLFFLSRIALPSHFIVQVVLAIAVRSLYFRLSLLLPIRFQKYKCQTKLTYLASFSFLAELCIHSFSTFYFFY